MPGPMSDTYHGTPDDAPYVPSWCYPDDQPKLCPCGHHEGYHGDDRHCLLSRQCGCVGLPAEYRTSDDAFFTYQKNGKEAV